MTEQKKLLLVASVADDALALMRLVHQLYGLLKPPVHIDALAVGRDEEYLAQAVAVAALKSGRYDSACCAGAQGVFYPVSEEHVLPALLEKAETKLAQEAPWERGRAGDGEAVSIIARPERLRELVHEAARRAPEARIESAALRANKNEWIEAGYMAAQLAQEGRTLLLLPGKNYVLDEEAELFCASLKNGCRVQASDLRAFYFVAELVDYASANFTAAQLKEVARLPADITPVYVDGAGRLTLSEPYEALAARVGRQKLVVRCGSLSHIAWQAPQEGLKLVPAQKLAQLCLPHGSAWELLGRPQPGDVVLLSRSVAHEDALEAA